MVATIPAMFADSRASTTVAAAAVDLSAAPARPEASGRRPAPARGGSVGTVARRTRRSDMLDLTERRMLARQQLLAQAAGTYMPEILAARDSNIVRWADRNGPLRVWIRDTASLEEWRGSLVPQVRGAFRDWEDTGIPVRFEFVTDSIGADVHVIWTDRFKRQVNGRPISGLTRWGVDGQSRITDAVIILALRRPAGDTLPGDAVHAMALHEIGHALGLDHCDDPKSVMAPTVHVRALSPADARTARLLYSLPPGALN